MKHNRTITEARSQELSERLYGVNVFERLEKLQEEFEELDEIITNNKYGQSTISEVKDELADCLFVLISLMGIYNTNIRELSEMAVDKIMKRESNPNYKR